MRILITGANGLLGQALVGHLASNVYCDVLATGLDAAPRQAAEVSFGYARMDIRDANAVRQIIEDFEPHWVINCAAMTQVDQCEQERELCWDINVQGVEYLAKACRSVGARLLQVSTDFVFDGTSDMYQENDRPNPVSFYGRSKLASENAARTVGIDQWCIIRTSVVYGLAADRSRDDFVGWVRRKLSSHEPIDVFTDQWRTPTYSYDLARGIGHLIHKASSGVFNLTGRDYVSMHAFAQAIADEFSLDRSLVRPITMTEKPQVAQRPERSGLIILKAETEIGYRPMNLQTALQSLRQELAH